MTYKDAPLNEPKLHRHDFAFLENVDNPHAIIGNGHELAM